MGHTKQAQHIPKAETAEKYNIPRSPLSPLPFSPLPSSPFTTQTQLHTLHPTPPLHMHTTTTPPPLPLPVPLPLERLPWFVKDYGGSHGQGPVQDRIVAQLLLFPPCPDHGGYRGGRSVCRAHSEHPVRAGWSGRH